MPRLLYGNDAIEFTLQPGDTLVECEPNDRSPSWTTEQFQNEFARAGLDSNLSIARPLVVVNDAYRPTPTGYVLSQLKKFFPSFEADYLIACGNHPAPTPNHIERIFEGFDHVDRTRIFAHNSRDMDSMRQVGVYLGQPLFVNRRLFEYAAVIVIGSVEPHYFAGFTGGRKSIIPGLSDIESNRCNHARAVSRDAQPLRLTGNPVAEDLDQLLSMVRLDHLLSIQLVTGREHNILGCFCGDLHQSFASAAVLSKAVYSKTIDRMFDLIIAEMRPPLDRNLYQMQKGIENCAAAVRDGGMILVVSACEEGIGNDEFHKLAVRLQSVEAVLAAAENPNPPLGIHKLSRIIELSRRIGVRALTSLEPQVLREVFIEPAGSIIDLIEGLRERTQKPLDLLVVRDAGMFTVSSIS